MKNFPPPHEFIDVVGYLACDEHKNIQVLGAHIPDRVLCRAAFDHGFGIAVDMCKQYLGPGEQLDLQNRMMITPHPYDVLK